MPKVTQIFFSIFLKLVFLYVFLCLWYTFCPISVFIFVEITKDFTQFSLISEASRCSWTIGHLPNSTQNLKTLPIGPWSWLMPKKGTCRQGTLDDFIFTSKYDEIWSKIIDLLIWLKIAIWHQSWYIIQTYMCFWVIVFGTSSSAALDGEGLAYKITDCQLRGFDLCRLCSRPSAPTPQYQHRNHNWNISSALHWDLLNQCLPAQNIQTSRDFNFEFAFSLGLVKTRSALSMKEGGGSLLLCAFVHLVN